MLTRVGNANAINDNFRPNFSLIYPKNKVANAPPMHIMELVQDASSIVKRPLARMSEDMSFLIFFNISL